jgi:hypothetical protein
LAPISLKRKISETAKTSKTIVHRNITAIFFRKNQRQLKIEIDQIYLRTLFKTPKQLKYKYCIM